MFFFFYLRIALLAAVLNKSKLKVSIFKTISETCRVQKK